MDKDKLSEEVTDKIADCVCSLYDAIRNAGGGCSKSILDQTLRQFISKCAGVNNIRFIYVPEEKREPKNEYEYKYRKD